MSTGTHKERITENNGIISENNADLTALKTRINNLPTSGDTTATANDILQGKTAVSKGVKITGQYTPPTVSLQSKDVSISQNGTTTVTPDQGYDGLSDVDVTVSGILDTSDANATASVMASGKTAYVNGQKITGNASAYTSARTMGVTLTNFNDLQNVYDTSIVFNGPTYFYSNAKIIVNIPKSNLATVVGATANKIKKDEVICGVTGTYEGSGVVSVPEKDVNFYDYDGTVVASYTASDFANLSALPNNPTHTGLTSQGWNWTLADAKTYVASYGKLNIGQMYVTDDGKTRIYIKLEEGRLEPYLGFAINGTATIDWGDNTTSTVTGNDTTTIIYTQHTYASAGKYIISIASGSVIYFRGTSANGSSLLVKTSGGSDDSIAYQTTIHKIEFSSNVKFENYAFKNCYSLSNVTIPFTDCGIGINAFQYCYSLLNIILPNKRMGISNGAFQYCYSLSNVILPDTISNFNNGVFQYCYSLSFIAIPRDITTLPSNLLDSCYSLSDIVLPPVQIFNDGSILANCRSLSKIKLRGTRQIGIATFLNCKSLKYCDLSSATSIPTLGLNAFNGIPSDCKIIVPDSLYEDWIVAGNWSTYASYIIKASDWT